MSISTTRISTLGLHQRTMNDFNKVQNNLYDLQGQISSGIKARDFKGMNGQVEQFTTIEAKIKNLNAYANNNTEAISRLKTTRQSIENIITIADQIQDLTTLRRNGGLQNDVAYDQQLKDLRLSIGKELNSSLEGRFLFGGTKTNVPPVVEGVIPESVTPGTPDDIYYQGSKDNYILRPQENMEKQYNIRADDPAFQKLFAGISLGLQGDREKDDTKIGNAYTLISQGLEDIVRLQARVDADTVDLQNINDRHTTAVTYFKGIAESISKTDLVGASTQVAVDQSILQANFQVFARISSLKLSDYLN